MRALASANCGLSLLFGIASRLVQSMGLSWVSVGLVPCVRHDIAIFIACVALV